jgi:hypothetical protein
MTVMFKQETYTCSATKQTVALSFTGRHLLQNLREAMVEALMKGTYDANYKAISRARYAIAAYMGKLEFEAHLEKHFLAANPPDLTKIPTLELIEELRRRWVGTST